MSLVIRPDIMATTAAALVIDVGARYCTLFAGCSHAHAPSDTRFAQLVAFAPQLRTCPLPRRWQNLRRDQGQWLWSWFGELRPRAGQRRWLCRGLCGRGGYLA